MRINNNIMAMNAYRNLNATNGQMSKSLEKLSSGLRINRAADDAAGLVISESLRTLVSGLSVASRNAQDGTSVVQIAEGALNEVHTALRRIRDLSLQAANVGANDPTSRAAAQAEVAQLLAELDRIGQSTRFGGLTIFTTANLTFQVGSRAAETLVVTVGQLSTAALTINGLNISTGTGAVAALTSIDVAIDAISTLRGQLGAVQNRFESIIRNLQVSIENVQASEGRIRDVDMAEETVNFTKLQILSQAGTAMLSQAKDLPTSVLSLLQGR
jgi:flagellin